MMFPCTIQIMWLVDIFRAKVVDTSEHSLTIEVSPFFNLYVFISNGQDGSNKSLFYFIL